MPSTHLSELLGPVTSALPFYDYHEALPEAQSQGEAAALSVATQWLGATVQEPFWPAPAVRQLVHRGDASTCDAVQHQFRLQTDDGDLTIAVCQTQFIVLVSVSLGSVRPSGFHRVQELGRQLFKHHERLNLVLTQQDASGAFGEQLSDVAPTGYDWLDTLVCWTDTHAIHYRMLKRTGPGQAAVVSSRFEANHKWFAAFERPRAT
jgi:hypothetical protein